VSAVDAAPFETSAEGATVEDGLHAARRRNDRGRELRQHPRPCAAPAGAIGAAGRLAVRRLDAPLSTQSTTVHDGAARPHEAGLLRHRMT
jgi:hypothetical protein